MQLNINPFPTSIFSSTDFYNEIKKKRWIHILLANEYEFINFEITQRYFKREIIETKNYDMFVSNEERDIVHKKMVPLIKGCKLDYIGDNTIGYIENMNIFPNNCDVGFIKIIGDGEIHSNELIAYEHEEMFSKNNLNCTTQTLFQYITWDKSKTFNKFIHNIDCVLKQDLTFTSPLKKKNAVFVYAYSTISKSIKYNELYSLPMTMYFLLMGIKSLKKGGDLYVIYNSIYYEASGQLMSIICEKFKHYEFIENKISITRGMYKFSNYDGTFLNLEKLLKKYQSIDDTLGCKNIHNRDNKIFFDFNIKIPDDFFVFLKNISESYILKMKKNIERINYIADFVKNPKKIEQLFEHNINIALKFANKHKLEITQYYSNYYDKLNDNDLKKSLFSKLHLNSNEMSKLKLTPESLYSVSIPQDAELISKLIKKHYPRAQIIADMTSNVGGNSINFCSKFKKVYSIEIDKITCDVLEHNLNVYNFKNYEIFNQSCLNFNKFADVYFYDPEWSGVLYGMNISINMYINNINIVDILKPNFCLKVPNNFNIYPLLSKFPYLSIHKIRNYMLIINSTHTFKNNSQKNKFSKKHMPLKKNNSFKKELIF